MNKKYDQNLESIKQIFGTTIFKAFIYTISTVIFSFYGINYILNLVFRNNSANQLDTKLILSLIIGGIFAMFVCTFMLLNEIKNRSSK